MVISGIPPYFSIVITGAESSLYFTGYAPTVSVVGGDISITPPAGSMAISGAVPAQGISITPPVGSISAVGYEPTVQRGGDTAITPDTGSINALGYVPAQGAGITPSSGSITAAGYVLSINIGASITPDTGSMAVTGYTPSIGIGITPDSASISALGYAPGVAGSSPRITPDTGSMSIVGYAPSVVVSSDAVRPAGGWKTHGAYDAYDRYLRRKKQLAAIESPIDREIASLMDEDKVTQIERIVAESYSEQDLEAIRRYSERVAKAYERAYRQGNYSAYMAFEREMERAREEEEFLLLAMMLLQ